jgi:NAD-dependent deacetylase
MKTIIPRHNEEYLAEAISTFTSARNVAALTGAGISVGSGIPDFRSPGGLWTVFSPEEYATIDVFLQNPQKAWGLYRELGKGLLDKKPNKAHHVLADLEEQGYLKGIVTQNIDNLHQSAGNRYVFEIHGDHQHLQCIQCGYLEPVEENHYQMEGIPVCADCNHPLKPNIVLFGESVRKLEEINFFIQHCDLLLVIGTSAKVYPAASLPGIVKANGGAIFEFNMDPALQPGIADYFFEGDLSVTLPGFGKAVLNNRN